MNTLVLKSDDLQFTYKKSCFTIQCVSMVTEVIDSYKNNDNSVICVCSMNPRLLIELIY